jgi:hypothetical protein
MTRENGALLVSSVLSLEALSQRHSWACGGTHSFRHASSTKVGKEKGNIIL